MTCWAKHLSCPMFASAVLREVSHCRGATCSRPLSAFRQAIAHAQGAGEVLLEVRQLT
jgi:hypothetical protein